MRLTSFALLALAGGLAVMGCSEGAGKDKTSDLTRSMLSEPVGDGLSTPTGGAQTSGPGQEPMIQVTSLGIDRGSLEAPVKVVEMSDYGCGYCRQFHQETFPTLLNDFVDSGMVEWKFVPYITGMFGNSLPATEAAECTFAQKQSAFEVLNSRLWNEQRAWKSSDQPAEVIRPWVEELGIDMAVFDACVEEDERLDRIASATSLARQLGVRGTPTFVVLGYGPLQGALPLETFQDLLSAVYTDLTGSPLIPE